MKLFKSLLLGAALMVTPAFAQGSMNVKMVVPYSFQAGNLQLAPGMYFVSCDMGSNILWFFNKDTGQSVAVLTDNFRNARNPEKSQARFRVYGDKHIWPASGAA